MNLENQIKRKVGNKKYPVLKRIRVGRVIGIIATLPLFTSWMFLISVPMMMSISPTAWLKGKINVYRGNGDLQYE